MLINFADATNDANHYTKPPPLMYTKRFISLSLPTSIGVARGCSGCSGTPRARNNFGLI